MYRIQSPVKKTKTTESSTRTVSLKDATLCNVFRSNVCAGIQRGYIGSTSGIVGNVSGTWR